MILYSLSGVLKESYKIILKFYWKFYTPKGAVQVKGEMEKYSPPLYSTDSLSYIMHLGEEFQVIFTEKTACIEPVSGWALIGWNKVISCSHPYWTNVYRGWPPFPSLIRYLNPFKRIVLKHKIIPMIYGWDNYYHFLTDTLPQIYFCKEYSLRQTATWIVPSNIWDYDYVKEIIDTLNLFKKQDIYFQKKNEYIISKEVCFAKPSKIGSERIKEVARKLLQTENVHDKESKLFLIRKGRRTIVNLKNLVKIAQKYGFEVVDPNGLKVSVQVSLFRSARYLIGIHGAGLTNIIFRLGREMSVLELLPKDRAATQYWHLAMDFGFQYDVIVGSKMLGETQDFEINEIDFENSIINMLHSQSSKYV